MSTDLELKNKLDYFSPTSNSISLLPTASKVGKKDLIPFEFIIDHMHFFDTFMDCPRRGNLPR